MRQKKENRVVLRFALFGCSGVAAHKERRTGDKKTVLNEDIEKLELFLSI